MTKIISPSLHEAVIERHFARDPITREPIADAHIAALRDAIGACRQAAERSQKAASAILRNEFHTLPARHRQAKIDAWNIVKPALQKHDAARANADAEVKRLSDLCHAPEPPRDAAAAMTAIEIRTALANMTPENRRRACATARDETVAAVLNAEPWRTSMTPEEVEIVRSNWQRRRYPAELARIERLKKALDDANRGGDLLLAHYRGLYDDKVIERAEATEREAREAMRA